MSLAYDQHDEKELLSLSRAGQSGAFGELWSRYWAWALNVARRTTQSVDEHDIVAEAFAKVLQSLKNGHGPKEAFAAYLATAIRNVAATWGKRDGRVKLCELDEAAGIVDEHEAELVGDVGELEGPFRSLPVRWQQVLWLTEVEGYPLRETAEVLDISSGAVTALAARARAGLRLAMAA